MVAKRISDVTSRVRRLLVAQRRQPLARQEASNGIEQQAGRADAIREKQTRPGEWRAAFEAVKPDRAAHEQVLHTQVSMR